MIRSCPHLSKYMSTPEDSRRFISANPLQDLEMGARSAPLTASSLGALGASATAAAAAAAAPGATQLAALQSADSALHHLHHRQHLASPALVSHLLAAGTTVADPLLQSLSLGGLHSNLLGGAPTGALAASALPTSPEPAQSRSAITSFLANSQSSGGAARNRQAGAKKK